MSATWAALARTCYEHALQGRDIYVLGAPICEVGHTVFGDTNLYFDPNMVDGHKHGVPPIRVTFLRRVAMEENPRAFSHLITEAIRQAIEGWDFWEHGGERRARVVRALKRRPFQPRWVSTHCGCPDHTANHRIGARP